MNCLFGRIKTGKTISFGSIKFELCEEEWEGTKIKFFYPYDEVERGYDLGGFTRVHLALLRSLYLRCKDDGSEIVLVPPNVENILLDQSGEGFELSGFVILETSSLAKRANNISFSEKCLETLENLKRLPELQRKIQLKVVSNYLAEDRVSAQLLDDYNVPEIFYSCNRLEAVGVMNWLIEERMIVMPSQFSNLSVVMTHRSLALLDSRTRHELEKIGFIIRKYDGKKDKWYRDVINYVQNQTGIVFGAVWDIPHNQKIDERIFNLIQDASVVLVDITGTRFNVGLEMGFALALNKELIVIRDKKQQNWRIPFDISTLNCYYYDVDDELSIANICERIKFAYRKRESRNI